MQPFTPVSRPWISVNNTTQTPKTKNPLKIQFHVYSDLRFLLLRKVHNNTHTRQSWSTQAWLKTVPKTKTRIALTPFLYKEYKIFFGIAA